MTVLSQLVLLLIILVIVVGGAYFLFGRKKDGESIDPAYDGRNVPDRRLAGKKASKPREVTLRNLEPGDVLILWDGSDSIVETVLDCEENVGGRATTWQWIFLSGGKFLEIEQHGNVLYAESRVLYQGSQPFAELTADVGQTGTLKTFEARVRAGTVASNPVFFELDGRRYQTQSTGTFVANLTGKSLDDEVWCDMTDNQGDNVFFKMREAEGDEQVLGIWTSHIVFLRGKSFAESDIRGLYGQQEGRER